MRTLTIARTVATPFRKTLARGQIASATDRTREAHERLFRAGDSLPLELLTDDATTGHARLA